MQILIHVNRTLNEFFIVVNPLMKVIFILGEYIMQSSKETVWTPIKNAMQAWVCVALWFCKEKPATHHERL